MKKWVEIEFEVGQTVYLKTCADQKKRIVFAIEMKQDGIRYGLVCGDQYSWHYNFEISVTADIIIKTSE